MPVEKLTPATLIARCRDCGAGLALVLVPDARSIGASLAGTPYAALAALIPASAAESLLQSITFQCPENCQPEVTTHASEKESASGEARARAPSTESSGADRDASARPCIDGG